MSIVRRISPFGELVSLRQAMDRLFEDSVVRPSHLLGAAFETTLPLDIRSTPDELIVEAALPGVKPDGVEITVDGGTLTISAQRHEEERREEGEYLVQEIRHGAVSRAIALPEGLEPDKATASFEHGVLTLRIPKAEQVKPRQIRITPAAGEGEHPGARG